MTLKEFVVVKRKVVSVPARYRVIQPLLGKHWCFLDIGCIKAKEDTGLKGLQKAICVLYDKPRSLLKDILRQIVLLVRKNSKTMTFFCLDTLVLLDLGTHISSDDIAYFFENSN